MEKNIERKIISKKNTDEKNVFFKLYESVCTSKELTPLDKLVYTIIRNRLNLSIDNNWNDNGEFYIYYSQDEIAELLNCSTKSVVNSFERLRKNNYIKTEKQKNNSLKIFFFEIECRQFQKVENQKEKISIQGHQSCAFEDISINNNTDSSNNNKKNIEDEVKEKKPETITSILAKFDNGDKNECESSENKLLNKVENISENNSLATENFSVGGEKSSYNKEIINKYNKKEILKKDYCNIKSYHIYHNHLDNENYIDYDMKRAEQNYKTELDLLKEQISYEDLLISNPDDKQIIDEFVINCMDMLTSPYTYINKQAKPCSVIKSVLRRLKYSHIIELVYNFESLTNKINNVQGYMKTMIYNICISGNSALKNQVNYDMYGKYKKQYI